MITDIKIRKIFKDEERLEALLSATLYGEIALHDVKIIRGENRRFVAMPSRRDRSGFFRDVVHPINEDSRKKLESEILTLYEEKLKSL